MAYFPLFIDLKGKKVLIIGAGKVAYRKIEKLMPFGAEIYVVAKEVKDKRILEIKNNINLELREFKLDDLENKDIVINATDDIELQKLVYEKCIELKIPINSVDSPKYCSFIFPAYIKEDEIVIGISTSGKAPILSKWLKDLIKDCLPKNLNLIFKEVSEKRRLLKNKKNRLEILKNILKKLEKGKN